MFRAVDRMELEEYLEANHIWSKSIEGEVAKLGKVEVLLGTV